MKENILLRMLERFTSHKRHGDKAMIRGYVVAILNDGKGNVRRTTSRNIIVTTGDVYYAQKAAGAVPTDTFNTMELSVGGTAPGKASTRSALAAPVAGSQIAFAATYPKTADTDPLNTGAGPSVITYKGVWGPGVASGVGIDRICITVAAPGAAAPLLMYAIFGSGAFTKGSADSLTVFVNHTFLGI